MALEIIFDPNAILAEVPVGHSARLPCGCILKVEGHKFVSLHAGKWTFGILTFSCSGLHGASWQGDASDMCQYDAFSQALEESFG